jgi:hypothetical protein
MEALPIVKKTDKNCLEISLDARLGVFYIICTTVFPIITFMLKVTCQGLILLPFNMNNRKPH